MFDELLVVLHASQQEVMFSDYLVRVALHIAAFVAIGIATYLLHAVIATDHETDGEPSGDDR